MPLHGVNGIYFGNDYHMLLSQASGEGIYAAVLEADLATVSRRFLVAWLRFDQINGIVPCTVGSAQDDCDVHAEAIASGMVFMCVPRFSSKRCRIYRTI